MNSVTISARPQWFKFKDVKWRTYTPMKRIASPVRIYGSTSRFRK